MPNKPRERKYNPVKAGLMDRRSLLEWLGKATVFSLGGDLITACSTFESHQMGSGEDEDSHEVEDTLSTDLDSGQPDTGGTDDEAGNTSCDEDTDWEFEPGEGAAKIFADWGERTVDPQNALEVMAKWTLRIDGLVEQPVTLTFSELLEMGCEEQVTDFHCVEGWSILDVPWNGIHLSKLFDRVGVKSNATHLSMHALGDIYTESIPLDEALEPKTLLSYGIGGNTLPLAHGFPVRLIVPRKFAYKSTKYVYRLELKSRPIDGFWVQRGYPYEADVPESRLRIGKY